MNGPLSRIRFLDCYQIEPNISLEGFQLQSSDQVFIIDIKFLGLPEFKTQTNQGQAEIKSNNSLTLSHGCHIKSYLKLAKKSHFVFSLACWSNLQLKFLLGAINIWHPTFM